MKNTKITQMQALTVAIDLMKENGIDGETIAVLEKMVYAKEKEKEKAKERRKAKNSQNVELAEELVDALQDKALSIADIKQMDNFKEFSVQKITAVLRIVKEDYELTVGINDEGKKTYKIEE